MGVGEGILITFISYFVYVASSVILYGLLPLRAGAAVASAVFLVTAYYLLAKTVGRPFRYVGLKPIKPGLALCCVLASIALIPLVASLMAVVMTYLELPEEWLAGIYELVKADDLPGLLYAWVVTALLAPVGEELVFRGILQNSLSAKYRGWVAVLIASAVFGSLHIWRFPAAFILGALLGTLYLKTASLVAPLIAHVTINSVVVAGTFAVERVDSASVPRWIIDDASAPLLVLVCSLAAFLLIMRHFWISTSTRGSSATERDPESAGDDAP